MKKSFQIVETFNVKPEILYKAWLDEKKHADMTGGLARVTEEPGASFSAWDGYISGKNITLVPGKKIVQSWRTTDFNKDDPDSQITVYFTETENGTELKLDHSEIPEGQPDYEQGWKEHYFEPMMAYFSQ